MNANELADELDKYKGIATRDAATMLRQLQAENEALKAELAQIAAEDKKLFEAVQKANDIWDRATGRKS